jgi:hypothetical protein
MPDIQAALSAAASSSFAVPSGFQIFILPAGAAVPGISGQPIPASFNLPAAFQGFDYALEPAAATVTAPAGFATYSPMTGEWAV